ncbi:MAG: hypothetical protein NZ869_01660 [Thermoanaerobaculum sp.]|nr:hypothetical protein [Thermoanaerobaculum sp.]MDW7967925.1 hypothetical protein [Thermoanaerobaculum sp.]
MRFKVGLLMALWATPALAAAGGGPETFLGIPTVVWKVANLVVFLTILGWFLARPLSRFFHARREEIARQLREAERLRAEASALHQEMSAKLAGLHGEIAALQERLRREGERERQLLVAEGEREAARFLRQVEEETKRRLAAAREELAREAAQSAALVAWEILGKEITPEDRERIFRATLARLQQGEQV